MGSEEGIPQGVSGGGSRPSAVKRNSIANYRNATSNTNSIDRNSHCKYTNINGDNLSITGNFHAIQAQQPQSPYEIKEFEKKLINLPTFTISNGNALGSLLPSAISNSSLLGTLANGTGASRSSLYKPTDAGSATTHDAAGDKMNTLNLNNLIGNNTGMSRHSSYSLKASVSTEIIRVTNQNKEASKKSMFYLFQRIF